MEENECENNDERIYSDSDTIENIVEKSTIVNLIKTDRAMRC
jgi:hypothetical protein